MSSDKIRSGNRRAEKNRWGSKLMRFLTAIYCFIGWGTLLFTAGLLIGCLFLLGKDGELPITSQHAVGVVELTGEILSSEKFRLALKKQLDNKQIKAIVVRIDSPGGSVGASQEIFEAISLAIAKKPVVCSLGNIAASGGLYAAVACQKIVTNRGTLTGSIGVVMMLPNFRSVMDRLGVGMNVIKSGKFKDAGSPFRDMGPEERTLLQELIDKAYLQFVGAIAEKRNLNVEDVKRYADGRIILGEDAVKLQLADEMGGLPRAAKIALELSGDQAEPEIIMPKKKTGILAALNEFEDSSFVHLLRSVDSSPQLLYLRY